MLTLEGNAQRDDADGKPRDAEQRIEQFDVVHKHPSFVCTPFAKEEPPRELYLPMRPLYHAAQPLGKAAFVRASV